MFRQFIKRLADFLYAAKKPYLYCTLLKMNYICTVFYWGKEFSFVSDK